MNARLARSISMFTIVPVRVPVDLQPGDGVGALLWLPAVGAFAGAAAALPAAAISEWSPHADLLGAVLAVASLALLTRCLHLDGLADTADGLGSGAPAARALEIMRQSDIGPFGVVVLIVVVGADVASLGCLQGGPWTPVGVLAIAAATGRVAAVHAAVRGVRSARESGFGSIVANHVSVAAAVGVDRGRARPGRGRRRRPVHPGRLDPGAPGHRAGRRAPVPAARRPAPGRGHRRRVRRADRGGDRGHADRRGAAVNERDARTWPRPVPLVGDPTSAADRSADPAGWSLGEPTVAALRTVLAARRDVRRYRPDPVPPDLLREVLTAGHQAPSVGHSQPWRFIVISEQPTRDQAALLADRERLRQAGLFTADRRARLLDLQLDGIREAPVGVVVACDRRAPAAGVLGRAGFADADLWSCACAIENMWLAARAAGLGLGWVTLFQPADLADLLNLPAASKRLGWLCLGWPDERPPDPGLERHGWSQRLPLDEVVISERWPSDGANHRGLSRIWRVRISGRSSPGGTPAMTG